MAKLIRVLTYEGTEEFINTCLNHLGVPLNGAFKMINGQIISVIAEAYAAPCQVCRGALTSNKTLICGYCTEKAVQYAKESK